MGTQSQIVIAPERHSYCPNCGYEIFRTSYGKSPHYQSVWHWCTRCTWMGSPGLFLNSEEAIALDEEWKARR